MAELAILGHATRGKEVIELLEMLGGIITTKLLGNEKFCGYYINSNDNIDYRHYSYLDDAIHFTLEEFLEKFPYKVGDKVQFKRAPSCGSAFEVEKMRWVDNQVKYTILWYNNCRTTVTAEDLQPYKEAPMYLNEKANKQAEEIAEILEPAKKIMEEIKLDIPDGYEFFGIDDDNKIVLTKKQPLYPKTYVECCKIVSAESNRHYQYTKKDKEIDYPHEVKLLDCLDNLRRLLICRDAYWKIAGDWKPDWNHNTEKYVIYPYQYLYSIDKENYRNTILAFPNAEMRDAFYENFKELIELCKELL